MWTWVISISMILLSPVLFNEELLEITKKLLKKVREFHAKEFGYKQMIKDIGPIRDWEYEPEVWEKR